jgi:hypothetical protein
MKLELFFFSISLYWSFWFIFFLLLFFYLWWFLNLILFVILSFIFFHIKFDLHSFDCSIFCLDKFFKLIFFPITYFNIKFSGNWSFWLNLSQDFMGCEFGILTQV